MQIETQTSENGTFFSDNGEAISRQKLPRVNHINFQAAFEVKYTLWSEVNLSHKIWVVCCSQITFFCCQCFHSIPIIQLRKGSFKTFEKISPVVSFKLSWVSFVFWCKWFINETKTCRWDTKADRCFDLLSGIPRQFNSAQLQTYANKCRLRDGSTGDTFCPQFLHVPCLLPRAHA